jgi:hypothetical protein
MDKKTKLWLGLGVVGVGAYLLFKSKKTTPALTAAPAKFVGADSFASVGDNEKFNAGGPEGDRMKNMINTLNSPTQKYSADGGFAGVGTQFRPLSGGMINSTDVVGAKAGSQNSGIFANQPFTGDVANMVGANGEPVFANLFGRRKRRQGKVGSIEVIDLGGEFVTADGTGSFFEPRTARYGQNEGVFAPRMPKTPMPRRTLPVEPTMPVKAVRQAAPLNNLVGQDGSRFFSVHDGFGK